MGVIAERIADIARRCGDLSPIQDDVRLILWEGNRDRALFAQDVQGASFAPLARSTIKRRQGMAGPPLAPRFSGSRVITDYTVQVTAGIGRLTFVASWPGEPWMEFHHTGTRWMPRRDPYGFREQDLARIRNIMSAYVMRGEKGAGGAPPPPSAAPAATMPMTRRPSLLERGRRAAAAAFRGVTNWPRRRLAGA